MFMFDMILAIIEMKLQNRATRARAAPCLARRRSGVISVRRPTIGSDGAAVASVVGVSAWWSECHQRRWATKRRGRRIAWPVRDPRPRRRPSASGRPPRGTTVPGLQSARRRRGMAVVVQRAPTQLGRRSCQSMAPRSKSPCWSREQLPSPFASLRLRLPSPLMGRNHKVSAAGGTKAAN